MRLSKQQKIKYNKAALQLMFLAIAFVTPLLVSRRVVQLTEIERYFYKNNEELFKDYYNVVKGEWLITVAIIIVLLYIGLFLLDRTSIHFTKWLIPALVFAALVVISTVLARYKDGFLQIYGIMIDDPDTLLEGNVGLAGHIDLLESVFHYISYVVLYIVLATVRFEKKFYIRLMYAVVASATLVSMIAVFQFYGLNFFDSAIGKRLILGSSYEKLADAVHFKYVGNYAASTMNNPNYLGGYTAMVLPISLAMLFSQEKRRGVFILTFSSVIIFAALFASRSMTGWLAFAVAFAVMVLLAFRDLKTIAVKGGAAIGLCCLMALVMNMSLVSEGIDELESLTDDLQIATGLEGDSGNPIDGITSLEHGISFEMNGVVLSAVVVDNNLKFLDGKGQELPILQDDEGLYINQADYDFIRMQPISQSNMIVMFEKKKVAIDIQRDNVVIIGPGSKSFPMEWEVESIGFEGREYLASGRGYIWSRTLPLLKDNIIIGSGVGSFPLLFPQYDALGKANHFNDTRKMLVKAHNLYLLLAVNSGVISMVLYMLILGLGILNSGLNAIKHHWTKDKLLMIAVGGGLLSYAVSSIANDSMIPIAATAWILMGVSMQLKGLVNETEQSI